jgi:hypothetical protein
MDYGSLSYGEVNLGYQQRLDILPIHESGTALHIENKRYQKEAI